MYEQIQSIPDVDVEAELIEGRLSMTAQTEAALRVSAPEHQPLSNVEGHLQLSVATADTRITFELDGAELDVLEHAIEQAQEQAQEADR